MSFRLWAAAWGGLITSRCAILCFFQKMDDVIHSCALRFGLTEEEECEMVVHDDSRVSPYGSWLQVEIKRTTRRNLQGRCFGLGDDDLFMEFDDDKPLANGPSSSSSATRVPNTSGFVNSTYSCGPPTLVHVADPTLPGEAWEEPNVIVAPNGPSHLGPSICHDKKVVASIGLSSFVNLDSFNLAGPTFSHYYLCISLPLLWA
ncbi:hypothetical protein C1H46_031591 [Malus baccata]|uniref:Uncharacterized protein n=1 Tax=Malus baccata TaxID=106549 RepID=A0A540L8P1_MALBA|nr:hypothetical protein C1H46_031591 [Malus baccata]